MLVSRAVFCERAQPPFGGTDEHIAVHGFCMERRGVSLCLPERAEVYGGVQYDVESVALESWRKAREGC